MRYGLLAALGVAIFVAPFACPWPDGLESVAAKLGFEHKAVQPAVPAPAPGYQIPGVRWAAGATALAGAAGAVVVFGLALLLARSLVREGEGEAHSYQAMIDDWIGHHHSHRDSPVSRLPAEFKLAVALVIIVGTVLVPPRAVGWFAGAAVVLAVAVVLSRVPLLFLLKRLAWLSPFILSVALVNALQPAARGSWRVVAVRSTICLLTIILVSNTTPFSRILRVLRRVHVPGLLITTIALMHRYLFVLVEEAERMRRARASRTFARQQPHPLAGVGHRRGPALCPRLGAGRTHLRLHVRAGVEMSTAIQVTNLGYRYHDGTEALRGVSFRVAPGECVGLLGPNGSGKSTLLLHLNGILPEKLGWNGAVCILDQPVTPDNIETVRRQVGLVFQDPDDQLFCPSVAEDVAFGPQQLGLSEAEVAARVQKALAQAGLAGFGHRATHHLSHGEKRRACLAGVLACEPSILVLDEPTSDLDPRGRREFKALLRQIPATKLIATHDLELVVELCSRAIVLDRGAVVADGPVVDLLNNEELMLAHGLERPHILRHRHPH